MAVGVEVCNAVGLQSFGFRECDRLDGPAALSYVRSRGLEYLNVDTHTWVSADAIPDISRIARQQSFIRGLAGLAVAKSLNDPLTANEIADRVVIGRWCLRKLERPHDAAKSPPLVAQMRVIGS